MTFPKHLKERQERLGATLLVENFVLGGLSYRYGNLGCIGIKRFNKRLEIFRRR